MEKTPRKRIVLKDAEFDDEKGSVVAVFATMNVEDSDGDITVPGAFGEQQVRISAYGHGSWYDGLNALPVGKGRIYERGNDAVFAGEFFLETTTGKEHYLTVKAMGDLQEWSYALPEIDFEIREEDGREIRILKRIVVPEVSPVLLGAGVNTRTESVKAGGLKLAEHIERVQLDATELVKRIEDLANLRESEDRKIASKTIEKVAEVRESFSELVRVLDHVEKDGTPLWAEYLRYQKLRAERIDQWLQNL